MDDADCEVGLGHALAEFDDLLLGVGVDNGLLDIDVIVEVRKSFELVLFLLDRDVVLVDTL